MTRLVTYTGCKYIQHRLANTILGPGALRVAIGLLVCAAAAVRADLPAIEITPATLASADAVQAGLAVMTLADQRDSGYQDSTVALTMVLRSANGQETSRDLRISQIEMPEDGDRMLVVFDTPRAIRGTALLSYSHPRAVDDQWLYLPALGRVKKINSRNKSGPFLSSEFAFEDLTVQEVEKYSYRYLGTMACATGTCYRVERAPLDEFSGYSVQIVAIDIEHLRLISIEYFDRRGEPLKTLSASQFQLYNERFWRASRMLMTNHQTGKSTELQWRDFAFATGLTAVRDFSTNALQRAR